MSSIYGVDFGTGDALAIFGGAGLVPKRSLCQFFHMTMAHQGR